MVGLETAFIYSKPPTELLVSGVFVALGSNSSTSSPSMIHLNSFATMPQRPRSTNVLASIAKHKGLYASIYGFQLQESYIRIALGGVCRFLRNMNASDSVTARQVDYYMTLYFAHLMPNLRAKRIRLYSSALELKRHKTTKEMCSRGRSRCKDAKCNLVLNDRCSASDTCDKPIGCRRPRLRGVATRMREGA